MRITYCAMRKDGTTVTATSDFGDIRDLVERLEGENLTLVSYREHSLPWLSAAWDALRPPVGRLEIVEFCESLASMVGSGLSLIDSLESIRGTVTSKRLAKALSRVIEEISRGESLSGAFSHQKSVFPGILVFFCRMGEETGTIRDALANTATYLRRIEGIVSQVKRAFIYPSFVVAAMGCVMVFWMFYVLPRLVDTFRDMNVSLPEVTLALVRFVKFMQTSWYLIPAAIAITIVAGGFAMRSEKVRIAVTKAAYRIPVVGDLLKASTLTLLFSSLSLMLRSGLTLTRSLDVLLNLFSNPLLKSIITAIQTSTGSGNSLVESFEATRFFDAMTIKMVSVGEKTGTLENRLGYLADAYQERTSRFVEAAGKMIEPLVMILSGALFIFIVVSLISPVYDLISQLGGG